MVKDPLFAITGLLIVIVFQLFVAIFLMIKVIKRVDRHERFLQTRDSLRIKDDNEQMGEFQSG